MRLLKIGRDASCDIVLQSPKVSALHAEITLLNNGDILLVDKESRNGTYIMNQRIKPNTSVNIKRGDAVRFADVELIWSQVPMPESTSNLKAIYGIGTNNLNEIQLSSNTVSRYHATLRIDKSNKATLEDHSKNGTTINGHKIAPFRQVPVKRGDSVVCGGVPVDLKPYIPVSLTKIVTYIAAVAIIAGLVFIPIASIPWPFTGKISPKTDKALENATACVYGGFYYVVTVNDDPFKQRFNDWPEKFYFSKDEKGNFVFSVSPSELRPIVYSGTAFFISKNGELGTNRHIAVPWEERSEIDDDAIRQMMQTIRDGTSGYVASLLGLFITKDLISQEDAIACMNRYRNSDITISGEFSYLGIGLTNTKVESYGDLNPCQVIAESGNPKKDVALIRLKTRHTPDYLVEEGAIFDISQARIDASKLQSDEDLFTIGYPWGMSVSNQLNDGKELHPTKHRVNISRNADDNAFQIQANSKGGQSGSPVFDKKHRLVGVLFGGYNNSDFTYCCNIKHLVELYQKNKVN